MMMCKLVRESDYPNRKGWPPPSLSLILLVAAICFFGVLPSRAAIQTDANNSDCGTASTTAAMRSCENARYEKAQQQLTTAFNDLMRQLDGGRRAKLRLAEDAWLKFREANADFEADAARGGTLAPLLRVSTLADMTEARAAELKKAQQQ